MQMQTFLTGLCKVFDTQVTIKGCDLFYLISMMIIQQIPVFVPVVLLSITKIRAGELVTCSQEQFHPALTDVPLSSPGIVRKSI